MSQSPFGDGGQPQPDNNNNVFQSTDQLLLDADGKPATVESTSMSRHYSYQGGDERATANFATGMQKESTVTDAVTDAVDDVQIEKQHKAIFEARTGKIVSVTSQIMPAEDDIQINIPNEEFTPKVKQQLFVACLFALLVGNMMLLNVASFLPTFIQERDWENNDTLQGFDVSLIISVFSVAQIVFAPFNSIIKNALGSKNTIVIGFSLLTITTFALGWIAAINNAQMFKYVAVVVRFFQGLGDILLQVTSYTVITTVFSDDVMKYISYIEITVGLGLGLGPALGSVICTQVGYEMTMYIFGVLNLVGMIICQFYIPKELNNQPKEAAEDEPITQEDLGEDPDAVDDENNKKQKIQLTWVQILKNRHFVFALVACFFGTTNLVYFQGYIGPYLGQFNFDEDQVGYVMAIQQVTYLPMCLILPHFCETAFPRKLQFVIAMFGFAICCFMMGPSLMLNFPQSYWIIIMAFPLMGVFQYFVFIPIIPEMLERVTVELNAIEGEDPELDAAIYDKVNDAYGFVYALAMFIGPLVGGYMHDSIGGRRTGDYVAISNLVVGALLFIFNCGPFVFQENRAFFQKLNLLKEQAEKLNDEEETASENDDTSINKAGPNVLSKSLFKSMIPDDKSTKSGQRIRSRVPHLNLPNGTSQQKIVAQEQKKYRQRRMSKNSQIIYTDALSYDGKSCKSRGNISARTFNGPKKK